MWYTFFSTGKRKYLRVTYTYIPPDLVQIHTEDVTELKEIGDKLTKFNVNLEKKIRRRTQKIDQLSKNLETESTERERMESVLMDSGRFLQEIANQGAHLIYTLDIEGKITYISPVSSIIFQRAPEEMIGKHFADFVFTSEVEDALHKHDELTKGRNQGIISQRIVKKNGAVAHIEAIVTAMKRDGETIGYQGLVRDVTEYKIAEEALQESETKYKLLVENARESILVLQEGKIVLINPTAISLFGYSKHEIVNKAFPLLLFPEDRDAVIKFHNRLLEQIETTQSLTYRIYQKKGKIRWINANVIVVEWNKKPALLIFATDITERRHAEEALEKSEILYRGIVEDHTELICRFLHDTTITFANEAYCRYFGKDRKEIIGNQFLSSIPETDRKFVLQNIFAINARNSIMSHEHQVISPTGEICWQRWTNRGIFNEKGEILEYQATGFDITEMKLFEAALRESEEKYRMLIENASMGIAINQNGIIMYANPELNRISGYSCEELISHPFTDFIHEDDRNRILDLHMRRSRGEEAEATSNFRIIDKNGNTRWFHVNGVVIIWGGKPATLNFISDITDNKLNEEKMAQTLNEKEALLREIHHRVKNNLQIISSLLDMTSKKTDNRETIELFRDVQNKVYTMALIHSQLYQNEQFDKIDIANHTIELIKYLKGVYSSMNVNIVPLLKSGTFLSVAQAIPCALVLNELISNAFKHAFLMKESGVIEVSIEGNEDGMISLAVKDNGVGIPKEFDLNVIHTLGLKLVRNLVRDQLKGVVEIHQNAGTEVVVRFRSPEEVKNGAQHHGGR